MLPRGLATLPLPLNRQLSGWCAAACLVTASLCGGIATAETLVGTASVIDGDTLEIHGQRIRLLGIDAIEGRQTCTLPGGKTWRCGRDASFALADRIGRAPVACHPRDIDRYGRVVAVCEQGGEDLNAWMVEQGWALAYRRYSKAYVRNEARAAAAHRGIWVSEFQPPWEWRIRGG